MAYQRPTQIPLTVKQQKDLKGCQLLMTYPPFNSLRVVINLSDAFCTKNIKLVISKLAAKVYWFNKIEDLDNYAYQSMITAVYPFAPEKTK